MPIAFAYNVSVVKRFNNINNNCIALFVPTACRITVVVVVYIACSYVQVQVVPTRIILYYYTY